MCRTNEVPAISDEERDAETDRYRVKLHAERTRLANLTPGTIWRKLVRDGTKMKTHKW